MQKPCFSRQQEDDIREAVFRYHMGKHAPLYFLSVLQKDPSPAFLARFHDKTAVRPVSAINSKQFNVTEKKTGRLGIRLYVGAVRWVSPDQAKVETGWLTSGRSGTAGTCLLQKQRTGWIVQYYAIQGRF